MGGTLTFFLRSSSLLAMSKEMTYEQMVLKAVLNIRDFVRGASRQAIKKYIETSFSEVVSASAFRVALKKLVDGGVLLQEGQRFKLEKSKRVELRKPAPKPKKKTKKTKKTKKKKTQKKKTKKKNTKKKTTKKKKTPKKKKTKKTTKKTPKKTTKKTSKKTAKKKS